MPKNVAIACQGGGSHTAFTAGALARLVPAVYERGHRLVGLSGASGGAISATTAWYSLLTEGPDGVYDDLCAFWDDIAAMGFDRVGNDVLVNWSRVANAGLPVPKFSPYNVPAGRWAQRELRDTLEDHIDFARLPYLVSSDDPRMVVGTVDINAGEFETFENGAITSKALLASAAVPDLFPAVKIQDHWHWDGLFSQNPPIHELMETDTEHKPDELWVIQINPQNRKGEPKSLVDIADRRNELSGNLSLNQELRFIEQVNRWVERGLLPEEQFRYTEISRLQFGRTLSASSKLDRSEGFIEDLFAAGEERAERFLAQRRTSTS